MERVRTIVRQDASDATAWLGRIRDLRHDPVEDRLLGVDIYDQRIVEFTIDGAFAGSFGRYGEGPGELRKVAAFEVTGRHAVVLDDTLVAVMPGPEGTLYERIGVDGRKTVRRASGMVAAGGGGRIAAGRLWAGTNTGALRNGSFFASAIPENMDVNPAEFWVLDRYGRVRQRYVLFDRPLIGISTASFPRVFAVGLSHEFGVYEYRLPADQDQP